MNRSTILTAIVFTAIVGYIVWVLFGEQPKSHVDNAALLVSVVVPEIPGELKQGKKLFDANCSNCHGANAAGKNGIGPPLIHIIYEPNHHSDGSFILAAKNGVRSHHWPFGNMPPVSGITESEVLKIIDYVRHLQRANGIGNSHQ